MTEGYPPPPGTPPPPGSPPPPSAPPPGSPPPGGYYGTGGPVQPTDSESRTWGMLAHLSALAGYIIPAGNILGPLIVWLIKKDQMPFVNDQGKESLNFQITVTLALLLLSWTICIGIGLIVLPAIGIAALVFVILASMEANKGNAYRYPWTLRLVK